MKSRVDEARTVSLPQRHRLQFSISQLKSCPMTESPDEQKLLRVGRQCMHMEPVRRTLKSQGGLHCSRPDFIPASSTSISLRYFELLHVLMHLSENKAIPPLNKPGQIAFA